MDKEFIVALANMSSVYRQKLQTVEEYNEGSLRSSEHSSISRSESDISIPTVDEEGKSVEHTYDHEVLEVEDIRATVDQDNIDSAWIKGLHVNFPLETYYKTLKGGLKVLLGVEGLHNYPEWSNKVF